MKIASASTTNTEPVAISELYLQLLQDLGAEPSFLVVCCSIDYDIALLRDIILEHSPRVAIHGGTSCQGVMTQRGVSADEGTGLAILAIADSHGSFGTGGAAITDDPVEAVEYAVNQALINADCPGEVPAMVWLTAAPGSEEKLLQGISNVLGPEVPVAGGSSADNQLDGSWKQFNQQDTYSDGVVVTVLFPSTEVMFAFHSGYEPTDAKGLITKTGGFEVTGNKGIATDTCPRTLLEIDNRPAAEVYNEWTGGLIEEALGSGGHILSLTTLHPLGRIAGYIGEIPYFQLSHPDAVTSNGALTLFSDIAAGDEIVLMQGTVDSLITRAGRVASSAFETHLSSAENIAGALIVYCAGCMLTVHDRMDEVVESICEALPGIPFLGTFTFGEQGCFLDEGNRHGNLMISVLLFSKE